MHAIVHIYKMQSYGSAHMEAQCSNYSSSNPSSTHVNNSIHRKHSGSASHCSLSAADLTPSQGSRRTFDTDIRINPAEKTDERTTLL